MRLHSATNEVTDGPVARDQCSNDNGILKEDLDARVL